MMMRRCATTVVIRSGGVRMFSTSSPFDESLKVVHRDNAARALRSLASTGSSSAFDFECLHRAVASQLTDRVRDITREFRSAADVGCHAGYVFESLAQEGIAEEVGLETFSHIERAPELLKLAKERTSEAGANAGVAMDYESSIDAIAPGSQDLVFSSLSLHWENDLPGALKRVKRALKPDGAFLGAMLGGDTLWELRAALSVADQERLGGLAVHVSPMTNGADLGSLLQSAGFSLLTLDSIKVEIEYANAFECMRHLGIIGESNASALRQGEGYSRETLLAAASIYQEMFGTRGADSDSTIPATFEVLFMIGWKPDASQAVPIERGSASASLKSLGSGGAL